jgi:hypothetical protein
MSKGMYTRGREELGQELPYRTTIAQGENAARTANIQRQGQLDVQRERGLQEQQKLQGYQELLETLGSQGASGGRDISRVSLPGGMSMSFRNEDQGIAGIPNSLLNQITNAQYQARAARTPEAQAGARAALAQAQRNALTQAQVSSPELHEWISSILADPATEEMQFDDILQEWFATYPEDADAFAPEEQEEARQIYRLLRGQ